MAAPSDAAQRTALFQLLERATKAGEPVVCPILLKKIKEICRKNSAYVEAAHHFLTCALSEKHSQVRLSALQICHELFMRSQHFRALLIADFKDFVERVVEVKAQAALPPPREAAKALNVFALQAIKEWHQRFGESSSRLKVAYNYLRRVKCADFIHLEATAAARAVREAAERERLAKVKRERLARASEELRATAGEVETACQAFDEACRLLVPEPDDFWIAGHPEEGDKNDEGEEEKEGEKEKEEEEEMTEQEALEDGKRRTGKRKGEEAEEPEEAGPSACKRRTSSADLEEPELDGWSGRQRSHGWLGSLALEIALDAPPEAVMEDEDNSVLLEALKDQEALLARSYLPLIRSWMRIFAAEENEQDRLRRCQDLKAMVQERLRQFADMQIRSANKDAEAEEEESEESEMEDVEEKEGYEEEAEAEPQPLPEPQPEPEPMAGPSRGSPQQRRRRSETARSDPTAPKRTPAAAGSERSTRAGQAPRLRFGLDLLSWGREAEPMVRVREEHYWNKNEPESVIIPKETMAAMQTRRAVPFVGEFRPVERECRAPLNTGGLCRRMDRLKCPFHGRIVARDVAGQPVAEAERARLKAEAELREAVERRQVVLAERRAKRATKLMDLRKAADTPTNRIAKRVLKKSALRRVADVMNAQEERRQLEKFGQQFNYILRTSRRM